MMTFVFLLLTTICVLAAWFERHDPMRCAACVFLAVMLLFCTAIAGTQPDRPYYGPGT